MRLSRGSGVYLCLVHLQSGRGGSRGNARGLQIPLGAQTEQNFVFFFWGLEGSRVFQIQKVPWNPLWSSEGSMEPWNPLRSASGSLGSLGGLSGFNAF